MYLYSIKLISYAVLDNTFSGIHTKCVQKKPSSENKYLPKVYMYGSRNFDGWFSKLLFHAHSYYVKS